MVLDEKNTTSRVYALRQATLELASNDVVFVTVV